jgi:CBS domain-containing protein
LTDVNNLFFVCATLRPAQTVATEDRMLTRDIMTERVISVTPDHSVRHAAEIMLDHHISGLPVIDGADRLVGMLTEGDLLRRAELGSPASVQGPQLSADYIKIHSWCVGDVMTEHAVTVEEAMPVGQIAAIMRSSDVKRLPVLRDGKMVGIVSRADILRAILAAGREEGAPGDEAIRRAIASRLRDDLKFDPGLVWVTVANGNVHLWGRVASEADRRAAHLAAESVSGVGGVVNGLRVADASAAEVGAGA